MNIIHTLFLFIIFISSLGISNILPLKRPFKLQRVATSSSSLRNETSHNISKCKNNNIL